ncbi:MAG TPA: LysR substrate-binding domain-containing protein [Alcanivorax sp.]|nr:LysR substrate-binding domain-containing protein [Alcanivorax sp.]
MDRISSEDLRDFLTVAEEGDFARAAQRLDRHPMLLKESVRELERDIGAPLLIVNPTAVTLTGAGDALVVSARALLASQEASRASRPRLPANGQLRIGVPAAPLHPLVPRILKAFRTLFPRVALNIREATDAAQLRELESGLLDIGFVHSADGPTALPWESLTEEALCVILPPRHPLLSLRTVALELLAAEAFILPPASLADGFVGRITRLCAEADFRPRVSHQAHQLSTVAGLVAAGLGVAIVPCDPDMDDHHGALLRPLTVRGRPAGATLPLLLARGKGPPGVALGHFLDTARRLAGPPPTPG